MGWSFSAGPSIARLKVRREITGAATPDGSFEFGAAGAQLAVDPGNKEVGGSKCAAVAEQACTAGHLLLYDAGHAALDEFDAGGEYLDRIGGPEFADAEPSGIAVDRSGERGLTARSSSASARAPGAKILAFGPLGRAQPTGAAPNRSRICSKTLGRSRPTTTATCTRRRAASSTSIGPLGNELTSFEDPHPSLDDLAVDSEGNVYVLEIAPPASEAVHYYTPSRVPAAEGNDLCPPRTGYGRTRGFPQRERFAAGDSGRSGAGSGAGQALPRQRRNRPGLQAGQGRLRRFSNPEFGAGVVSGSYDFDRGGGASARNGGQTTVYVTAGGSSTIQRVNGAGDEVVGRIDGAGCPRGAMGASTPRGLAVDQADGHVLEFQAVDEAAREYDGVGSLRRRIRPLHQPGREGIPDSGRQRLRAPRQRGHRRRRTARRNDDADLRRIRPRRRQRLRRLRRHQPRTPALRRHRLRPALLRRTAEGWKPGRRAKWTGAKLL